MQWEVTGADRATGADRTITLDADDEAQAVRRAGRRGLIVERAVTLPAQDDGFAVVDPEPPGDFDEIDLSPPAATAGTVSTPAPVPYATPSVGAAPSARRPAPPTYAGIANGATVLNVLAGIFAVTGLVTIALGIVVLALFVAGGAASKSAGAATMATVFGSVQVVGSLLFGAVQLSVAALIRMAAVVGLAVRDIARNSYR